MTMSAEDIAKLVVGGLLVAVGLVILLMDIVGAAEALIALVLIFFGLYLLGILKV